MWYAIVATDHADSLQKRLAARPAHVERLKTLLAEGRLLLAGPFPAIDSEDPGPAGFSGSLIIAEFADDVGCATPLFTLTQPVYAEAMSMGLGDQDTASVFEVLKKTIVKAPKSGAGNPK